MRNVRTAGQKMHLISLANPGFVSDAYGGYSEAYTPCTPATVYASIEPATVRDLERVMAGTIVATASHIVTIDFHPQVTHETRITFGTRMFDIAGVRNIEERNVELVLACTEQLSGSQPT